MHIQNHLSLPTRTVASLIVGGTMGSGAAVLVQMAQDCVHLTGPQQLLTAGASAALAIPLAGILLDDRTGLTTTGKTMLVGASIATGLTASIVGLPAPAAAFAGEAVGAALATWLASKATF